MSIDYPNTLDSLSNPNGTDSLSNPSHSQQHSNANDAIEALQVKVGVDGSQDTNSLDYKVSDLEAQIADLEGNNAVDLLGMHGNNDSIVTGIENKTVLDSFSKTLLATVRYQLQLTRGSLMYTSTLNILNDNGTLNMVESDIISNTDINLANVTFEENSGIINLCITPTSTSVNARYYRTSLKA